MCTVSFISRNGTIYLTSNRDENVARKKAFKPAIEQIDDTVILFPKDPQGGGSWFIINEHNHAGILLNGAFKNHVSTGNYARSRGLILLEVMTSTHPYRDLSLKDLKGIEPFTLILFQDDYLYQCRWDGLKKYFLPLPIDEDYIWSSSTLYDIESKNKRECLFKKFVGNTIIHNGDDIINFHLTNQGDFENGFVIKRKSGIETLSVTQAVLNSNKADLFHYDLDTKVKHKSSLVATKQLS